MKKALLFLIFAAGVNSSALLFSDDYGLFDTFVSFESWPSLGFEYGNFFDGYTERDNTVKSYMGSPGINFGGYQFLNGKNIGIFVHDLFAFPAVISQKTNGITTKDGFGADAFYLQVGMIIGPGFRYSINERLKLKYAVGPGFLLTAYEYAKNIPGYKDNIHIVLDWNLGIGGDVGLKFDITSIVFLAAGSIFTFDFARFIYMETPYGDASGWARDFYMVGIRPYIAIGISLRWES